jgi:hypothetical protein
VLTVDEKWDCGFYLNETWSWYSNIVHDRVTRKLGPTCAEHIFRILNGKGGDVYCLKDLHLLDNADLQFLVVSHASSIRMLCEAGATVVKLALTVLARNYGKNYVAWYILIVVLDLISVFKFATILGVDEMWEEVSTEPEPRIGFWVDTVLKLVLIGPLLANFWFLCRKFNYKLK